MEEEEVEDARERLGGGGLVSRAMVVRFLLALLFLPPLITAVLAVAAFLFDPLLMAGVVRTTCNDTPLVVAAVMGDEAAAVASWGRLIPPPTTLI